MLHGFVFPFNQEEPIFIDFGLADDGLNEGTTDHQGHLVFGL